MDEEKYRERLNRMGSLLKDKFVNNIDSVIDFYQRVIIVFIEVIGMYENKLEEALSSDEFKEFETVLSEYIDGYSESFERKDRE